ncbi:MAG TPA: type II secretion system F family protein [Actinomycetota bacterium]|nr:type II secretion system F family protein [Actinomycetota bacterium]
MNTIVLFSSLTVAAGLGAVVVGVGRAVSAGRVGDETLEALLDDAPDTWRAELSRPFAERVLGPAAATLQGAARRVTPAFWLERMRRNAMLAGMGRWGVEGVLSAKALFAVVAFLAFAAVGAVAGGAVGGSVAWGALVAAIAFFVPDLWMARRADSRQAQIRRALPETLDLLAIAVGAGLGLEAAIELVARKLPGPLGEELHRFLQEVQLGASRREALANLRERTDVTELSTFALTLAQADALGTPLAEVLKAQAGEMRMLRRMRARETAAKTPVKLLVPLLLGIFPALGIVIIGPAVISIARAFAGF